MVLLIRGLQISIGLFMLRPVQTFEYVLIVSRILTVASWTFDLILFKRFLFLDGELHLGRLFFLDRGLILVALDDLKELGGVVLNDKRHILA